GRRVQHACRLHRLALKFGQRIVCKPRFPRSARRLQASRPLPQGIATRRQGLLEWSTKAVIAGVAGGAGKPEHGGGRQRQRLRLPAHGPQAHFGRMPAHPARRPLQLGRELGEHRLQALLWIVERTSHAEGVNAVWQKTYATTRQKFKTNVFVGVCPRNGTESASARVLERSGRRRNEPVSGPDFAAREVNALALFFDDRLGN